MRPGLKAGTSIRPAFAKATARGHRYRDVRLEVVFVFGQRDGQGIGQLGAGFEDVGGPVEDLGEELDRIDYGVYV